MTDAEKSLPFNLHPAGFLECFQQVGADTSRILKAAEIPPMIQQNRADVRISVQQLGALLTSGIEQCRQTDIGYRIGAIFPWCYYGDLAGVIDTSPSLKEAGAAFRRYVAISHPHLKSFLASINFYFEDSFRLVVPITSPYDKSVDERLRQFDIHFRTAITCRLASSCGDRKLSQGLVLRVQQKTPLDESLMQSLGIDRVIYGAAENAFSAEYGFFESEWRNIRRPLFNRIIARCESVYQAAGLSDSVAEAVRWHVDSRFIRNVELEPIAAVLGMSARSLSRKLAADGVCFRDLVLQARMNLALRHIVYSQLSIDDMAVLIGFSTSSSFMRAVKSWTGLTVSELRGMPAVDVEQMIRSPRLFASNGRETMEASPQANKLRSADIR